MKRSFIGAFVAVIVAGAITVPWVHAQSQNFVPRQVIVKFRASVSETDSRSVQSSLHATVRARFASIDAELWEMDGVTVPEALSQFASDPRIEYIEPNYIVSAIEVIPNDPRFTELWGMHNTGQSGGKVDADIDAPEAWSIATGGSVLVGVIDTGVDWDHVDLAANIFTNEGEIPGNGIDDDGNGFIDDVHGWDFVNNDSNPNDDHGHGTHVSGTIAALGNNGLGVVGVSWSAKIIPLKFLDAGGFGDTADAIKAVEYATMMGARLTSNSWGGGGYSEALRSAIQAAGNQGILFVAAAGNAAVNTDISPHYPSAYNLDNIISVASTDRNDLLSGFSNWGPLSVDLGAPGSDILSTFPNNTYGTLSGTSMATPHVSGAICLTWAYAPLMTSVEMKNAILAAVDPLPALAGKTVTGGRLNVNELLAGLDDVAPARVTDLAVESTGSTSARLTWTATGDDGPTGQARTYDLRYSTSGIYWSNFAQATPATGEPAPQAAGAPESFEITGLDYNTRYYFALVVRDEQQNASAISNLPNGVTLGAPELEYAPPSFSANLLTGGMDTQILNIENTGEGTLDFLVQSAPSWVQLSPPSGRVSAGETLQTSVKFDATSLAGGNHDGAITLATNDMLNLTVQIPVSLFVTDAPDIVVSPLAVDFGSRYTGTCDRDSVMVTNIGTIPLNVSGVLMSNAEFSVPAGGFVLAPGETRLLEVDFCPVSIGSLQGVMTIQSDDPDHPEMEVALAGVGIDPPVITVAPLSLSSDQFVGGIEDQTLTVSNNGGSNLDFEIAVEEVEGAAATLEVFGGSQGQDGVIAVGRPLSSAELRDLKASFRKEVSVGPSGEIDRDSPSAKGPGDSMVLGRIAGNNLEEVFGNADNMYTAGPRTRGNLFTCTTSATLVEHRLYMNPLSSTQLWFLVYEGLAQIGTYSLISASNVSPAGPGLGWYSSGEVDVPLEEGRFYLIAASFEQISNYFNQQGIAPYPIPASFGELTAGAGWNWAPTSEFPPAPNQDVPDFTFADPVAYYQTLVTGGVVRWLSVDPEAGTVGPSASMNIGVRFDATGMFGGDYDASVRITSNDPVTPEVVVPAHFHVTGAPDISVSKSVLDYGSQFIGAAIKDTLTVSNPGTDALTVWTIVSDRPDYTVDLSSFVLAPTASQDVVVTFAPTATGPASGMLTIVSNDPDESLLTVELQGSGVEPPIIGVTPPSFSADLVTGETASSIMTVSNSGASPLTFEIKRQKRDPAVGVSVTERTASGFVAGWRERTPAGAATSSSSTDSHSNSAVTPVENLQSLQNGQVQILIIQDTLAWGLSMHDFILTFFGIEATVINSLQIATTNFSNYDLIITTGDENSSYYAALTTNVVKFENFVSAGGIVQYQLATQGANVSLPGGAQVLYGNTEGFNDIVAPGHPIVAGLTSPLNGNWANHTYVTGLPGGATVITETTNSNVPTTVEYKLGGGTVIATGMTWEWLYLNAYPAGAMLGNAVEYSLSLAGVPWLSATPGSGTVLPGESMDVTIGFDAAGLYGGDYAADLIVVNNDPLDPEVAIPADMHVTGAPDISAEPDSLSYGAVFIGGSAQKILTVSNAGTDLLTVSAITLSHGDYAADPSSFSLAPTESQEVVVTFAPTSATPIPASLSIASDDPDEPSVLIVLDGEGLEPPVISVSPTSLAEDLFTGQTASAVFTISNSGNSALDFVVDEVKRPTAATSAVTISPAYVPGTRVDNVTSTGASQASPISPTAAPAAQVPDVLVIQDVSAWGVNMATFIQSNFGFTPAVINSSQIVATDFSLFDLVITTGAQTTAYYTAVSSNAAKFEAFVSAGGVVQYQAATFGPSVAIAGGAMIAYGYAETYNDVVAPDHPIVAGLPAVLNGSAANHNYVNSLPPGATVITQTTAAGVPTTVEYDIGAGTVIATGMTWEFLYNYGYPAGPILYNAVGYALDIAGVTWLTVTPGSGSVPPGQSVDVTVEFDAAGLFGGDYAADLHVTNNDPLNPDVVVTADLHVTGVADIDVTPLALSFGSVFLGTSSQMSFNVSNVGTDMLTVSALSSSHGDYSVDVMNFTLAPSESQDVTVTFAPAAAGASPAILTVASDDPDEPAVMVSLDGEGLEPPAISVTPTSLTDDLFTGQKSVQTLTISNTGLSPLEFEVTTARREGAAVLALEDRRALAAGASVAAGVNSSDALPAEAVAPAQGAAAQNPAVLVIQDYASWGLSMGPFLMNNFGIAATVINSSQVASTDFSLYDLVITTGAQSSTYYSIMSSNVNKFEDFASAGGVVQYQGATYGSSFAIAGGAQLLYGSPENYNDVVAPSHPIAAGLPAVLVGNFANHNYLGGLPAGSTVITTTTASHVPTTAEYGVGLGRVIATGMTWEFLFNNGYPAGLILYNAVAYSLSRAGVTWLDVTPATGTIAAGESMDLSVGFDAAGLTGGDYGADLHIASNDPVNAEIVVPVDMHVTGVADITITPLTLMFGPVYMGEFAVQNVIVSNDGTDSLVVSDISASLPDYSVNLTSFTLPPGASQPVQVKFEPLSPGVLNGTLTVLSNDPDEGSVPVALEGAGVETFPDIAFDPPDYVYFGQVAVGSTAQGTILVSNEGTGLLTVSDVSVNHPDYAVDVSSFTLARGGSRVVVVSFTPSVMGTIFGSVTFTSDDPDEGVVSIFVLGEGTEPPVIAVDPSTLAETIPVGGSATRTVIVSNSGLGSLSFGVEAIEVPVVAADSSEALGGGPDPFGYRWSDSNDPGGPVYSWIDAIGGANVPLSNDDFEPGIPLGFTFHYYGSDYTAIGVGSNGWLSFNGSGNGFPAKVPFLDSYAGAIAPYARDLNPLAAGYVRYRTIGTEPGRQFVIEYNNISDTGGLNPKTFEVILTEGVNSIRFQYKMVSNAPVGLGIESPDQTQGMGNNATGDRYIDPSLVQSEYAVEFSPATLWLSVTPAGGAVPSGGSTNLMVTMDATDLEAGVYAGQLNIRSNDPVNSVVTIPVSLTVEPLTTTGVGPLAIPTRYELLPNHPNPFNPTTTIPYELPEYSRVRLVIYDVNGKLVAELVGENQPPGRHEVTWNGRSVHGDVVASGVYFYRLIAGKFIQTRKMVLLK